VWSYSAIQVSRQVLARKVLGLRSVYVTPLTFLGTNLGPWRILFPLLAFFFRFSFILVFYILFMLGRRSLNLELTTFDPEIERIVQENQSLLKNSESESEKFDEMGKPLGNRDPPRTLRE